MAFKMNRPLKMKGPMKSVLKLGRAKNKPVDDSGLYYNSSMGPMKMHSPSALRQMEEEAGMEETMGMMGEMGGEAPAGPVEEAPVEKESEGEKAEHIAGQEIVIEEDGTMVMTDEYGVAGVPDGAEVKDPDGILEIQDGFVMDNDYTFEVVDGDVIITGERELEEVKTEEQMQREKEMREKEMPKSKLLEGTPQEDVPGGYR
jgi:hypothetical protein